MCLAIYTQPCSLLAVCIIRESILFVVFTYLEFINERTGKERMIKGSGIEKEEEEGFWVVLCLFGCLRPQKERKGKSM